LRMLVLVKLGQLMIVRVMLVVESPSLLLLLLLWPLISLHAIRRDCTRDFLY
jgi:hypothetical protein